MQSNGVETQEQTADRNSTAEEIWRFAKVIGGSVLVGGLAVAAVPLTLSAIGFSSGGIVRGTPAARMMPMEVIARGGGVAAGGLVPTLQSIGAVGLSDAAKTVIGTVAGGLYALFNGRKNPSEDTENQSRENVIQHEGNRCKICMDREMNAMFKPCGHLCACQQCATRLSRCPLCKQKVEVIYIVVQKKGYKLILKKIFKLYN